MKLYYVMPAKRWEETLPIGNGSLGAMIWGGENIEHLGLNEESLWSGYYHDKNNSSAYPYLDEVRNKVFNEKYLEAEQLIQNNMLGEYNESYLPLGNLYFDFHHRGQIANYQRTLDLSSAVVSISYSENENEYKREYFASYPAKAIFMKFSCNNPEISFTTLFESQLKYEIAGSDNALMIKGHLPEHVDPSYINDTMNPVIQGDRGMKFDAGLQLFYCDGLVDINNKSINVKNAKCVIMSFSAVKTSRYDPSMSYDEIKDLHIKDYQAIFKKVELYLGEQSSLPTNERLARLRNGEEDNALYALYFQYGRYLLISSSRYGSLPANLQGIWSWELRAPWSSNWTTNINLQMNYWPVQNCNLQECIQPYVDFVQRLCEEGKKTAKIHYNCRGFVHHHNADFWCNTNPVGLVHGECSGRNNSVSWSMWPMGGAWLTSELFKHFEYNPDMYFLRKTVYPVLREATLFLIDWVVEYKDKYVTCPSTSPENFFITEDGERSCVAMSSAMDLAIVREVFGNFVKTCQLLNIKDSILQDVHERLERLQSFGIGSYGQLLEWHKEFKEEDPGHRHLSHLYGLFPSELFSNDVRLTEACKVSLFNRLKNGGGHTGWSCAWIINMFAVLGDGQNAYQYLNTLLTKSSYDNLWDKHPPFQIDGNFGGIAGIANMLVQDRGGVIKVLPALPKEFKEGYARGLRVKNGKTVDIEWKNNELVDYRIY